METKCFSADVYIMINPFHAVYHVPFSTEECVVWFYLAFNVYDFLSARWPSGNKWVTSHQFLISLHRLWTVKFIFLGVRCAVPAVRIFCSCVIFRMLSVLSIISSSNFETSYFTVVVKTGIASVTSFAKGRAELRQIIRRYSSQTSLW